MPVFSPVFGSMKSPSLAKAITEATAPEFCVEVGRTRSKGLHPSPSRDSRFWPHRRTGRAGNWEPTQSDGGQFSDAGRKANLLDRRSVRWTLYCIEVGYSIGLNWSPLG